MADEKLGIANLKPLVALVVELGNVGDAMGRTQGVARYGQLLSLVDELASIGGISSEQVIPELKDLDESERAELLSFIKVKFDIPDDVLEATIESALSIVVDAVALVTKAIALVQSFKAG